MTIVGFRVVAVSALIYWWAAKDFDAYRGDFFYLADAFLHGRTWLDFAPEHATRTGEATSATMSADTSGGDG